VQQELVREEIERMGHKNKKPMEHHTQGHWLPVVTLLLRYRTSSQRQHIYHTEYLQNTGVHMKPPNQSKIIYHNARDAKRTSTLRGTAHAEQDA
jgi:hypothetical protein